MKKGLKKLTLNRETLRVLGTDFRGVAGGVETLDTSCPCDNATGCGCDTDGCYPPTACLGTCSCSVIPCR
jgi:hypothetical protein